MAGIYGIAIAEDIALVADTAKLVLATTCPQYQRQRLLGWSITPSGTAAVSFKVRIALLTGTLSGTTVTPAKSPNLGSEVIQSAFLHTVTGHSVSTVHRNKYLQAGYSEGMDLLLEGNSKYGMEITSVGAAATVRVEWMFEE
jgi:hypothetical protein